MGVIYEGGGEMKIRDVWGGMRGDGIRKKIVE